MENLWIQDGTAVTTAVILLALQHHIGLIVLDKYGMPKARLNGFELHTTPAVQKAQVIVSVGPHAVTFIKHWTAQKIQHQADFLEKLKSRRSYRKQNLLDSRAADIRKLRKRVVDLHASRIKEVADELRGLEGAAGQLYFQTLSEVLPEVYRFDGRSRQPAKDPFNAFLNYGYAILYNMTEKALLLAGVNPYIGFMHRDGYKLKSMVFDFIEPYRLWVERVVFRLFSRKLVTSNHTAEYDEGLHLNTVGKELLIQSLKDYLREKKAELDGAMVGREYYLQQTAFRFARRLMQLAKMDDSNLAVA